MKSLIAALAVSTALAAPTAAAPTLAAERPVMLTVNMADYGGPGTYPAMYVSHALGTYAGSLWMAGGKSKYCKHLSDWVRFTGGDVAQVDGIAGASVGEGRSLSLTMDLADALFDAGYTLHIDAAAEDMRGSPNEVAVPLTGEGAGKPVAGRRYVAAFTCGF